MPHHLVAATAPNPRPRSFCGVMGLGRLLYSYHSTAIQARVVVPVHIPASLLLVPFCPLPLFTNNNMHFLHLSTLALAAHATPRHAIRADKTDVTLSGTRVNLSIVAPFEPWPGYFPDETPKDRATAATGTPCDVLRASPEGRGWLLFQAVCDRPNDIMNSTRTDCISKADDSFVFPGLPSPCGPENACIEYHGYNQQGTPAWDIVCRPRATFRQWYIDTEKSEVNRVCSPDYVNDVEGNRNVQLALQTNVIDSIKTDRIQPYAVSYLVDDKEMGNSRNYDSVVGSGLMTVPHGSKVQACIVGVNGQALWAIVTVTALRLT